MQFFESRFFAVSIISSVTSIVTIGERGALREAVVSLDLAMMRNSILVVVRNEAALRLPFRSERFLTGLCSE
jgi:hypothetical protein